MARSKKNRILPSIEFTTAGSKGVAIGKAEDGKTVMVKNAVPGDIADVSVRKKRKNFYQGVAQNFQQFSEDRTQAKCSYFGICGGCTWQNMKYDKQLYFKEKEVSDNLYKIAKVDIAEVKPIEQADSIFYYRNKMEFSFSNQRWLTDEEIQSSATIQNKDALGFHLPGMWSKVIDIKECLLQEDPSNEMRNFIREYALENNISFYDLKENKGVLRTLMLRKNHLGEWMLVLQFGEEFDEKEDLLSAIQHRFPMIKSLQYSINTKQNDSIYDLDLITFYGDDYIMEEMHGLQFKITAKSFFQTNYTQASKLYALAKQYAKLQGDEIVYDLYTGTGTIAQYVSSSAKKVVGIESVQDAVNAAKENASLNNIDNCDFFCGDMKEVFNVDFVEQNGKPDVVITDPPRDGMHAKVVESILSLEPKKIVYISCNSSTQARDIALLKDKYDVHLLQAVDMFPQTYHVESIAVLELKK